MRAASGRAALAVFMALAMVACVNLDPNAHDYPCTPGGAASECPGGWICGVSLDGGMGICHAPVPAGYSCLSSTDCEGWICSRADHSCHDPDAGGYVCLNDNDCAFPFRCGLGVCVNAGADGLDPAATLAHLGTAVQVSPPVTTVPSIFEVSPPFVAQTNDSPTQAQAFALGFGNSLEVLFDYPAGIGLGNAGGQVFVPAVRIPISAPAVAVGLLGASVFWNDGSSFHRADVDAGDGNLTAPETNPGAGFVPTTFRTGPSTDVETMFAFDDQQWQQYDLNVTGNFPVATGSGLVLEVGLSTHLLDLEMDNSVGIDVPMAVTDLGVFFFNTSSWVPLSFQAEYDGGQWVVANQACASVVVGYDAGPGIPLTVTRLHPGQAQGGALDIMAEVTSSGGGPALVQLGSSGAQPCVPAANSMNPPCPACPPGDSLISSLYQFDFTGQGFPRNILTTRCRHTDASGSMEQVWEIVPPDPTRSDRTACQWEYPEHSGLARVEVDLATRAESSAPASAAFVGNHGQIWFSGADSGFTDLVPLFLDQAPDSVTEFNFGPTQLYAANVGHQGWTLENEGYVQGILSSGALQIPAVVDGERSWGVLTDSISEVVFDARGGTSLNKVPPTLATLDPTRHGQLPIHAAISQTSDGGALVLVSEFDAFSSADVTAFAPGQATGSPSATPVNLQIALVPQPQIPIISVASINPPREGYAEAYLITPIQIVHALADNNARWSQEVIDPPDDPSNWLAVWSDGDRGRIGFTSGVVYSLPTRVALSGPLPGGVPVDSYAHVCQTTFALAGGSLYRLTPSANSPVGTWADVTAEAGLAQMPWLTGGRIFWATNALIAFSPFGQAYRVPIVSGCP